MEVNENKTLNQITIIAIPWDDEMNIPKDNSFFKNQSRFIFIIKKFIFIFLVNN